MSDLDVQAAAAALEGRLPWTPEVLVVLGSGLGDLAREAEDAVEVPFGELPGFPAPTVEGHAGRYVAGLVGGRRALMQAGRFHLYEGHSPDVVAAPVRVAGRLGVRTVVLTNAAGGVGRGLEPGSLMLIDDHVNLMWTSPLVGPVREGESRFPDMSRPYDPALQELAAKVALDLDIALRPGVYAGLRGPSYETPAEIRMMERLGVDAVGMSTVPEVLTARALGMSVLAFSMITNRAAGLSGEPLSHDDVVVVAGRAGKTLGRLIRRLLPELP